MKKDCLKKENLSEIFSEMVLTSKEEKSLIGGEGGPGTGSGNGPGTGPDVPVAPIFDCLAFSCKNGCKYSCKDSCKDSQKS